MKNFIFLTVILFYLLLIIHCPVYAQEKENTGIDIIHYNFEINYLSDLKKNALEVKLGILLKKNPGIEEIELLFNSDSRISAITCKDIEEWTSIHYKSSSDNKISLVLPSSLLHADEVNLLFNYEYPIDDSIKSICYLDRGYRWYPLIIDDIAQFIITADISTQYKMFSAGDLVKVEEKNNSSVYIWESKLPVFKIPFILIRESLYRKVSKKINENEILFCFLNKDSIPSEKILNEAEKIFQFCDTLIGSYHYHQLTFIEMPEISGSMIGSGIVVVGSDFIQQYKQEFYNGLHLSIAAQWFGCSVFGKFQDKGFWFFSLSLPHYLRLMYLENSKGKEVFENELLEPYKKYLAAAGSEKDLPISLIDMIDTKEKGLAIYGKGPYLIDILRKDMNDQKWVSFLLGLYNNNKGKILTYESFKIFLSELDNDLKLEQKFEEMMTTKGPLKTTEI